MLRRSTVIDPNGNVFQADARMRRMAAEAGELKHLIEHFLGAPMSEEATEELEAKLADEFVDDEAPPPIEEIVDAQSTPSPCLPPLLPKLPP